MKPFLTLAAVGVMIIFSCGCATRRGPRNEVPRQTMPAVIVQEANTTAPTALQARQGLTRTTPPANVQQEPLPIWTPAQVVRVELAPYVNEKGEAFPASYKYVVVKGGAFNSDALENPEQAYIPADNIPQVPGNPSMTYTPMVSPGSGALVQQAQGGPIQSNLPVKELYDMSQVMILGLFEATQGIEARAMVPDDYVAVYDENLGWIGVPKSHLMGVGDIQSHAAS